MPKTDEVISDEEVAITSELATVLDRDSAFPAADRAESGSQESSHDRAEKGEQQRPARRVSVQDSRLFVEFPYDRAKVATLQPLKDTIEDWAFNRYKRQEWSFPQD